MRVHLIRLIKSYMVLIILLKSNSLVAAGHPPYHLIVMMPCTEVDVELLVMDYWCNWSKSWSSVLVEDKSSAAVVAEATDRFALSCETYVSDSSYVVSGFTDSQPLSTIAALAEDGNSTALDQLNEIFGGYQKAWVGAGGQYIDAAGEVIDAAVMLTRPRRLYPAQPGLYR